MNNILQQIEKFPIEPIEPQKLILTRQLFMYSLRVVERSLSFGYWGYCSLAEKTDLLTKVSNTLQYIIKLEVKLEGVSEHTLVEIYRQLSNICFLLLVEINDQVLESTG